MRDYFAIKQAGSEGMARRNTCSFLTQNNIKPDPTTVQVMGVCERDTKSARKGSAEAMQKKKDIKETITHAPFDGVEEKYLKKLL